MAPVTWAAVKRPKDTREPGPRPAVPDELLERCRRGDEAAWRELVGATHREVYALCLRILGDPDDAAEATQETFVRVWRGLRGFRAEAAFSTWLYRVASNAALTVNRKRRRTRTRETNDEAALELLVAAGSATEEVAGAKLEVAELERALAELAEHYRQAVVLRDVYGLTIEEVAQQLKISETAAKVRVHRGRKQLKERLFPPAGS